MKRKWWGYLTLPAWPLLNYLIRRCEKKFLKIYEQDSCNHEAAYGYILLACVCVFLMGEK